MLDNTIITKFELSEREKMLKRQFFKREEEPGKKYLFYRPQEKNDSINKSNYSNNSHSLSLEPNQNTKLSNQLNINLSNNDKLINSNSNINQPQQNINQNLSNSIPDIKNITQEDMKKFYEEAANYLPKSNGGMSSEQINLLMHQNKIMQKNVDALQETNRSLQDFIIYSMKKDSMKNRIPNEINSNTKEQNNIEYAKLNKLLTPLYNHINNLQSQVKELNQKKREDEINVELDDLIIKNQKNFKPKHMPLITKKKQIPEDEKNNKIMMKTLSSLKGTMTNMTEQMKKIGNTFNEKMQKVLEDTEKNKLKSIVRGGRSNSTINNKGGLGSKNILHNEQSNNISLFKENGGNENESILKNKLDSIDYNSFKADLIDIGDIKDSIVNDYKSGVPEFPKLTKPKTKIKFSYDLDKELNNIMDKVNNANKSKQNLNYYGKKNGKNKNPPMKEKVSNAINKDKRSKSSINIPQNKKNNNENINNINNINDFNNKISDINYDEENEKENNMKKINELSVVDQMNLYKQRMAQLSGSYEIKENNKINPSENPEKLELSDKNNVNDLGSNHSGITLQKFNRPSGNQISNKNGYNPPKVKYGVFHGQKGIPNYNPNLNNNEEPHANIPNIVLPDPNKLNNVIKDTIDNYLAAAFKNLNPSEAPKIPNNKNPPQNVTERVIEREIIIKPNKVEQKIPQPQPIIVNPPAQQDIGQNKEILEKFVNLAEKLTNLEEKITNKVVEEKHTEKEIKIIEKKERIPPNNQQPNNVILPNTDLISKLVYDKIKKHLNIELEKKQKIEPQPQPQPEIVVEKEEDKMEEKIDIFDVNNNINMEQLEDKIQMPHKINLAEYEVSQTSSYLSESLQRNNININNSNQINYNKININIKENSEMNINQGNNDNSRSEGETSNNENTSHNDNQNINNNMNRNKAGIDLLHIKDLNEQFQNNINILENNNNIINIPQISQDNNYHEYLNYINNNINNTNNNIPKSLNPFSQDNFFNDSD